MLKHIYYKKFVIYEPHPLQEYIMNSQGKVTICGHRTGRSFASQFEKDFIKYLLLRNLREDIDNGGSPCA